MEFYFTDRNFKLQGMASTDAGGTIKMSDDLEKVTEADGIVEFTGTLYFTDADRDKVKNMANIGNYILYRRHNGDYAAVSIMETTRDPLTGTQSIIAEDAGLDLLNNVVQPEDRQQAETFEAYFNRALADTGFVLGTNIFAGETRVLVFPNENTAIERLRLIIEGFGGGRFKFEYGFNNVQLVKKTINVVESFGERKAVTLRVGREVNNIATTTSIYDLMTAVLPFGNVPEGSNSKVGLSGYPWVDPDGRFEIRSGVLVDTQEAPNWSRIGSDTNGLLTRTKTYDANTQGDLLALALDDLKKCSTPIVNYSVDLAMVPEGLDLGDTVGLVDENEELFLTGRVLEMSYSSATLQSTIVLGEFIIQYSGLNPQLERIASDFSRQFDESIPSEVIVTPSKQFFVGGAGDITLSAEVIKGVNNISDLFSQWTWSRYDSTNTLDPTFSPSGKTITITNGSSSVYTYYCTVDY
jgi:phage minor structural protein